MSSSKEELLLGGFSVSGIETQIKSLKQVKAAEIPHGATFPVKLIEKYDPRHCLMILDAGCGTGKSIRLTGPDNDFLVNGIDINTAAVVQANANGFTAYEHDVTKIGFAEYPTSTLATVETYGAFLAEGLLCNLVETQPENFLKVVDYYLGPGRYVFVADILQPQEDLAYLMKTLSPYQARILCDQWEFRYKANQDLGLDYGTFVVAKLGSNKEKEWGNSVDLQGLKASPDFERFARHFKRAEIDKLFSAVGYEQKEFIPTIFYSRTNEPLLGFFAVYEKPDLYRYHPWFYGKTLAEAHELEIDSDWIKNVGHPDYFFKKWAKILKGHLPDDLIKIFPGLQEFLT